MTGETARPLLWVVLPPVLLDDDVLSTACRQRHTHRPCGLWDASSIDLYCLHPAFECILAVVPHPLVSISETAQCSREV